MQNWLLNHPQFLLIHIDVLMLCKKKCQVLSMHGLQLSIFLTHIVLLFVVSYIGLLYYEWKGKEYLMTFTASKKLNRLLEVQ